MLQACVVIQFFCPLEPVPSDCAMASGCAHKKYKKKNKIEGKTLLADVLQ